MTVHHLHHSARRTAAIAAVLLCAVFVAPIHAGAAGRVSGTGIGSGSVTSGKWLATVSPTGMTFTTATDQTATVANTGTIALSGISYKVIVSTPASGSPTFKLYTCAVAWSSNKCSGVAGTQVGSTLSKGSTTTVGSTVAIAVGSDEYLQVEPTGVTSSVTVTLGTSINPATQLRSPIPTNH